MALFLRGNVWWMEYRTRKVRRVMSTGFRKDDKAKAQAAFDALRLGMGSKPRRSAMEGILEAIYGGGAEDEASGLALSSLWTIYQDWCKGKGKVVSRQTEASRRGVVDRLVKWADGRGLGVAGDVTVAVARDFVVSMREGGLSNKTLRTYAQYLAGIWKSVGQMVGGRMDNPWLAACPDPDGSGAVREAFTAEDELRVLAAARGLGHGWWLASVISRWTGLRYGDVARLDWGDVDLGKRVIRLKPSKTRKHGVTVAVPISETLYEALAGVSPDRREGYVLPEHAMAYPNGMEVSFSDVLGVAGLDDGRFTFHSWRHTFRTRLAEAGVSDEVARRLGGWTNLRMAAHYDHASHLGEMRAAVAAMEGAR